MIREEFHFIYIEHFQKRFYFWLLVYDLEADLFRFIKTDQSSQRLKRFEVFKMLQFTFQLQERHERDGGGLETDIIQLEQDKVDPLILRKVEDLKEALSLKPELSDPPSTEHYEVHNVTLVPLKGELESHYSSANYEFTTGTSAGNIMLPKEYKVVGQVVSVLLYKTTSKAFRIEPLDAETIALVNKIFQNFKILSDGN